jgi:hypothetical protein
LQDLLFFLKKATGQYRYLLNLLILEYQQLSLVVVVAQKLAILNFITMNTIRVNMTKYKNKYTQNGKEKSLDELAKTIVENAKDSAFEKYWVQPQEEVVEVEVDKSEIGSHIVKIADLYGDVSAVKAVTVVNKQFNTAYTISDIRRIWSIIDAEMEGHG